MDPVVEVCVMVIASVETRKDDIKLAVELAELRAEFKQDAQYVIQVAIASDILLGAFEKCVQVLLQTGRRIDANLAVSSRWTKLNCVVMDFTPIDMPKGIEDNLSTVHCEASEHHVHTSVVALREIYDIQEATPLAPAQLAAETFEIIAHVFFTA